MLWSEIFLGLGLVFVLGLDICYGKIGVSVRVAV